MSSTVQGLGARLWSQPGVQIPALRFTSCVTPGMFFHPSLPRMLFSQSFTFFVAFLKCHLSKACTVHSIYNSTSHSRQSAHPRLFILLCFSPSPIHLLTYYFFIPCAVCALNERSMEARICLFCSQNGAWQVWALSEYSLSGRT